MLAAVDWRYETAPAVPAVAHLATKEAFPRAWLCAPWAEWKPRGYCNLSLPILRPPVTKLLLPGIVAVWGVGLQQVVVEADGERLPVFVGDLQWLVEQIALASRRAHKGVGVGDSCWGAAG